MSDIIVNPNLHHNQCFVANELGLDAASFTSAESAVAAIEVKLGSKCVEERARWFVMSVLRHLKKAKWMTLAESKLDDSSQRVLVKDCLAREGFVTSLRTLTKDDRSKYRIVGFASSKNIERAVLATGTKAYTIARNVLLDAGLVAQKVAKKQSSTKAVKIIKKSPLVKPSGPGAKAKTVVGRRAERRAYSADELTKLTGSGRVMAGKNQAVSISEE